MVNLKNTTNSVLGIDSRGNVFCLGNPQAKHSSTICEGVADCLALASRLEGLAYLYFGNIRNENRGLSHRWKEYRIERFRYVVDNDSAGKEQAEKLRTGLIEKGIPALIEIPPPPNKDFAALAETETPAGAEHR